MQEFLTKHAVFTVDDLDRHLSASGSGKINTRKSLLAYYRKKGRVVQLRRGLYLTVPLGEDPATNPVDPYLVAVKLQPDAVLSYHTALEFHGKAYSTFNKLYYSTRHKSSPFKFRSLEFISVQVPLSLRLKDKDLFGVSFRNYSGVNIKVTTLERTFVDVLNRPGFAGSFEEVWRSLESIEFFDLEQVVEYVYLLDNSTTAAKVGFFLDQHREALMVDNHYLDSLRQLCPKQPHYFTRESRKDSQLVKDWNLLVPTEVINKAWGELQ